MRYRSTIVYLVAALVLGGIYFLDIRSEKKEEAREEEAKVLFPSIPEELTRLTLRRGERTVVLEKAVEAGEAKGEKAWIVKEPVETGADTFSVNRITSLLPHLKFTRIIQESGDTGSFGLEPPPLVLAWAGAGRTGSLSIGEKSPIDQGFYAQTGDGPRIFLLAAHDKEILDKDLFDLRDRRLFTFGYDRVTRISLERPNRSWSFVKSGETTWTLEGDSAFPVDSEKLGAAVRHLTWEEAASFEKEEAKDLSPYGLDRPALRVTLRAGEDREQLLVGKSPDGMKDGEEKRLYARMAERPHIVTIKAGPLEELPQTLEDVRAIEPEGEEPADRGPEKGPGG